jgi:DivIVA domain-containing protein
MDISPQTIRSTGFKTVKKGYDPDEVESFRNQVAAAVETAQNQATAMEARARAAVAKLQEVSHQMAEGSREAAPAKTGDTENISRTLLLAQRTADAAVAEARAEADKITSHAREEASRVLDSARTMAAKTVDDSRADARRAVEDERVKAENEVQALLARRDFLLGDVDHLEQYLQAQRERLRDAAVQLQELIDRVPGGLGDMRRPLLSASAEPLAGDETAPMEAPHAGDEEDAPVQHEDAFDDGGNITAEVPVVPADPQSEHQQQSPPTAFSSSTPVDDSGPLFVQQPQRNPGVSSLGLSGIADAQDSVWRLLDEEVATTQAAQAALALDEVTSEVPVIQAPAVQDPFRIGGDELR